MQKVIGMLLLFAVMSMVVVSFTTGCGTKPQIVTQAEADQVKDGMSYEEVARIIGDPGKLVPSPPSPANMTPKPPEIKHYVWLNDDKSSLTVDFINNKMVLKSFNPVPTK